MEGRRAPNLFALGKLALMQNFILKVRGPSECLIGSPLKKLEIANRDASGESQVVFQLWSSLVVSSPAFFGNLSCVFGEPAIVRPCSTLGFFWTSSRDDFWCFLVSGADLGGFGAPLCSFFAPCIDKFTHLCQLAPPDDRLSSKWGHQVDFSPRSGVGFLTTFWYFFIFFGILRFYEN